MLWISTPTTSSRTFSTVHFAPTQHSDAGVTNGSTNTMERTKTVKDRVILGIGLTTVERPRQLQVAAQTDEHSIVHTLYRLEKEGLTEFRHKRNLHSPGKNLTDIRLTKKGIARYQELSR